MAMAVAIDNARLALDLIPRIQRELDRAGGDGGRFHIHRFSAHATIVPHDPEIWRQLYPNTESYGFPGAMAKVEALDWQADPYNDLGDAAVLHHLQQQAATVPLLSSVISQSDHSKPATTLVGSALSASINAKTQGRLLSSFHWHSHRVTGYTLANSASGFKGATVERARIYDFKIYASHYLVELNNFIVWAAPRRDDYAVFWQLQWDVVDLSSPRTYPTYRPRIRRRTPFNQFLQVSDSPVIEDRFRGNSLPHARRFNGVRHRPGRRTWVAEMKPPKHKTKQDFGNFKSEVEAAHAVDAAFHHYGRPDLLNFPHTSLQFLSTRPTAAPGLDEKAKVKFVKEEAKLLLANIAVSSPAHSTRTSSLQILELAGSPKRCPSNQFRSLSEISSLFRGSGPDDGDDAVSQPQPCMLLDSICDISTTGVQTNLETLNSVQSAEWGWDCAADSSLLAAPPNVVNPSACEIQSKWLDSLIRSPPAPTYSRSPSPSPSQHEIAYGLLEQQSI